MLCVLLHPSGGYFLFVFDFQVSAPHVASGGGVRKVHAHVDNADVYEHVDNGDQNAADGAGVGALESPSDHVVIPVPVVSVPASAPPDDDDGDNDGDDGDGQAAVDHQYSGGGQSPIGGGGELKVAEDPKTETPLPTRTHGRDVRAS